VLKVARAALAHGSEDVLRRWGALTRVFLDLVDAVPG